MPHLVNGPTQARSKAPRRSRGFACHRGGVHLERHRAPRPEPDSRPEVGLAGGQRSADGQLARVLAICTEVAGTPGGSLAHHPAFGGQALTQNRLIAGERLSARNRRSGRSSPSRPFGSKPCSTLHLAERTQEFTIEFTGIAPLKPSVHFETVGRLVYGADDQPPEHRFDQCRRIRTHRGNDVEIRSIHLP